MKWEFARKARGEDKFIVVNGDEGDPGSYIDKYLMEYNPSLLIEGMAIAGYAVGATRGFVLVRSEYPRSTPALRAAIDAARAAGHLGENIYGSGFSFDVWVEEGAGSYVVGEETALLNSLQGLRGTVSARPPFPGRAWLSRRPDRREQRRDALQRRLHRQARCRGLQGAQPGRHPGLEARLPERAVREPGVYEVAFGTSMREICMDIGGGMRDGRELRRCRSAARWPASCPASLLDTPFDFDQLAAEGCMVGHGGIVAFDDRTDMRALARHLLHFGTSESCGKCFPCRIGLRRALEMVEADGAGRPRGELEELLETLEVAQPVRPRGRHAGAHPQPDQAFSRRVGGDARQ